MCEQCLVNPLYFGEVLPGWYLIRARRDGNDMKVGEWGMVQCNDPTFTWMTTPKVTKEEYEDMLYLPEDFDEALYMNPINGHNLITSAIEAGYSRKEHGHFSFWLFWYLSEFIRNNEPTTEEDSFPENDNFRAHNYTIWKD